MPKKSQRKNLQTQTNHFYSDYIKKDMLYASLIRSPVKSGTIVSINVPSLPDGYFFFSANDITGKNTINIKETEIDIFCKDKISYKGQAIGLIAGPNEDEVKRLVSKTEITIKNLEEDNTEKNKNKEIEIKEENISARRIVKTGIFLKTQKSSEKNFPKENIEVSSIWCYDTVQDLWKEPSGAFCFYEDKNLYIYTPTNIPHFLKHLVANALNIQEDSIIIQKTNNSGHEANGLWRNAILVIQASLASYLTGKAVRLCLSREEHNAFMQSGVRSSFECKSFVSKEGLIHSLEMNIKIDIGSCNPFAEDIIDRLVIASCNIYSIPNILIDAIALRSEKSPSSINPELVDSPAFFAIENHIMQIAERLSLLPIEVQQKNISTSKAPTMPFNFKLQHIAETIENTLRASDFNRKKASFELDAKTHISRDSTFFALPIRGIACACAFDGSGFLHDTSFLKSKKISLVIESETSALIYADMPSETVAGVWKKMLSQATNISENNIQIIPEPASSDTSPSFYSNIGIMTELLHQCCKDLNKKMEKPTFPISIKKGIPASAKKMWNRENFSGYPFYASSFASTALELELASHTYNVNIKGIWITIDCGKILVTKAAENAVRIAIQQELNHLIAGQSVHCEQVHIAFIKSDRAPVQIGSLIHSTLPAAFSNAMSQALGIKIHSIPCNTEMLYTLGDKTVGGKA